MRSFALAAVLIGAVPNCTDLYSVAARGVGVPTITAGEPTAFSDGQNLHIALPVDARNPNHFPLTLTSVDYDVQVDGSDALAGSVGTVTVAAQDGSTVPLTGSIDLGTSRMMAQQLAKESQAHVRVLGTAHLETPAGVPVDVDFDVSGLFSVPPLPSF